MPWPAWVESAGWAAIEVWGRSIDDPVATYARTRYCTEVHVAVYLAGAWEAAHYSLVPKLSTRRIGRTLWFEYALLPDDKRLDNDPETYVAELVEQAFAAVVAKVATAGRQPKPRPVVQLRVPLGSPAELAHGYPLPWIDEVEAFLFSREDERIDGDGEEDAGDYVWTFNGPRQLILKIAQNACDLPAVPANAYVVLTDEAGLAHEVVHRSRKN